MPIHYGLDGRIINANYNGGTTAPNGASLPGNIGANQQLMNQMVGTSSPFYKPIGQPPTLPGAGGPPPSVSQPQYSNDQIKQFVQGRGIENNPYAMYSYAQQYGVGADQVDKAMGYDAGTSQKWIQQQGLSMPGQQPPTMPNAGGQTPSQPNPYAQPNPGANPLQPRSNAQPGQQNPYMSGMADDITRRVNNNLTRNVLPGIGRGAVAAGGYGGSRQGVAEGLAIGESQDNLAGQLTNLYSGQFNTDRNYGLANDAMDLNVYNANQNWMNQGQQNQLSAINSLMGWNQQGINNATQVQQTPLNYYSQFANLGNQFGGMGGTNSNQMPGNPYLGAIGGAQLAQQVYKGW